MLTFRWPIFETTAPIDHILWLWKDVAINPVPVISFRLLLELECRIDNSGKIARLVRDSCYVMYDQSEPFAQEGGFFVVYAVDGGSRWFSRKLPNYFDTKPMSDDGLTDAFRATLRTAFQPYVGLGLDDLVIPPEQFLQEARRLQDLADEYQCDSDVLKLYGGGWVPRAE